MKDPLPLMVTVTIACILGILACETVITIHERTTAVPNNQTDMAQHR
jgi:hypothetical protein